MDTVAHDRWKRLDHLSFKGNLKNTRYGWLRLTPAYSLHLVSALLASAQHDELVVLDPFCGTGTTALVCAEQGIACDTTDINPFLLWLGRAKTYPYSAEEIGGFLAGAEMVAEALCATRNEPRWLPPLYQIEKWWDKSTLNALARAIHTISTLAEQTSEGVTHLLKVAFCQTMIEMANVSFRHQSMSFRQAKTVAVSSKRCEEAVIGKWNSAARQIAETAQSLIAGSPRFLHCDARHLLPTLEAERYSCVITSPPYPNRMSYIRELRPYMYWLDYLRTGREAGELDWQAIGGTWGCATSNLYKWQPDPALEIPFKGFPAILENIAQHSPLLSTYVQKYFYDMAIHCDSLFQVVRSGGTISYVVGNSRFYDVMLPVEAIFASLFEQVGFVSVQVCVLRKRSSKKELFEFEVSARKP